jgi:hypothetical protein
VALGAPLAPRAAAGRDSRGASTHGMLQASRRRCEGVLLPRSSLVRRRRAGLQEGWGGSRWRSRIVALYLSCTGIMGVRRRNASDDEDRPSTRRPARRAACHGGGVTRRRCAERGTPPARRARRASAPRAHVRIRFCGAASAPTHQRACYGARAGRLQAPARSNVGRRRAWRDAAACE